MRSPNQYRKLVYGLLIVLLFGAMFPYANWLEREKRRQDLGEAAMGQIDTGSFMLKLVLLGGARGVAANVLWTRAEDLKREQDWDRMASTVDLITKLQPHFLSVWTFQGWNLAYNVSVEWDAPEDKYDWIKKGIKFLQDGVRKNRKSPDLIWDTAWTYYHKIGFADEAIILRRLFRDDEDDEFKSYIDPETNLSVTRQDNFQLAYGWFSRAVALVDEGGVQRAATGAEANLDYVDPSPQRKGRPGDLAFRAMPAHAQTRYALSLEKMSIVEIPATFGEVAKDEWRRALNEWVKFGEYNFEAFNDKNEIIHLDDSTNMEKLKPRTENAKYWTNRWSDQMNYRYWKDRCLSEMTNEGVQARQLFYEGTLAYKDSEFEKAVQKYHDGLDIWTKLLEKHRDYRNDDYNKKDTGLVVKRYTRALKQLGEPEPKDMPFKDLLQAAEQDNTLDPFDATEMLGTNRNDSGPRGTTPAPGPKPAPPDRK